MNAKPSRSRTNAENATSPSVSDASVITLVPLDASGIIVTKQALVASLRPLVPNLVDIQVDETGASFYLLLAPEKPAPG